MRDTVYIIADVFGAKRLTKRAPDLGRMEVAIKLVLTIPDGCFRSPIMTADLDVPEDMVIQPTCDVVIGSEASNAPA